MEVFLWILGIHLTEIILVLGFLLIKKNRKLEEMVILQQDQINSVGILIGKMNESFMKIDEKVWISEEEGLSSTFQEMKEIQELLNSIK